MKRLLTLLLVLASLAPLSAATPPPNIVIIFMDDMGYGDIGPYGATKQKTPSLDRMAKEGKKLTSFYAAPVCSVSRAQLLTGCYGARIDVPGVYGPGGAHGLNPKENTIADLLKKEGYATMCVGKWHVGDQPEFLPTRQGFDHYFGIPYSNDMQLKSTEKGMRVTPLLRDDKVERLLADEEQSTIVADYTKEAVQFITSNKENPFSSTCPTPPSTPRSIPAKTSRVNPAMAGLATGSRKWTGAPAASSTPCGISNWTAIPWSSSPATTARG